MVEGQLRDSIRSIPKNFYTTRTRVRSRYTPTPAKIHPIQMGRTRRETWAGFWSGIWPRLSVAAACEKRRVELHIYVRDGGGGGLTSRVRDHVRPRDPGGEAILTVSPQRMITDDVFQTVEQSRGGSLLAPPRVLAECMERTMADICSIYSLKITSICIWYFIVHVLPALTIFKTDYNTCRWRTIPNLVPARQYKSVLWRNYVTTRDGINWHL